MKAMVCRSPRPQLPSPTLRTPPRRAALHKILPVRIVLAHGLKNTSSGTPLSKSQGVGHFSADVFRKRECWNLANSYEVKVEASESSSRVVLFKTVGSF